MKTKCFNIETYVSSAIADVFNRKVEVLEKIGWSVRNVQPYERPGQPNLEPIKVYGVNIFCCKEEEVKGEEHYCEGNCDCHCGGACSGHCHEEEKVENVQEEKKSWKEPEINSFDDALSLIFSDLVKAPVGCIVIESK